VVNAVVLGAGMVGSIMARDLAADPDFSVTIADSRPQALEIALAGARHAARDPDLVATVCADLSDTGALSRLIERSDIVLGALASRIGFQTLQTVIQAGKNYCDISFMPEDALSLDALAKSRGVTAIVDCGVAPGMSNMFAGYLEETLRPCHQIEIYVGGLPRERRWPFQYKAAFSPHDVIEEYTRPSRLVEHGRTVVREALTEPELMEFPHIGTLEAFNTDGLRSLASTLNVPFMKEKTMRYPGHIELMRVLRHIGLFSTEPVELPQPDGSVARIRPLDLISRLVFPQWTYGPGEEDLTVMRVSGSTSGTNPRRITFDLFDTFDQPTQATSMARTTAFPCTIMARLIAAGTFRRPGVAAPEVVGPIPGMLEHFLREHALRAVKYTRTG
jgi:saccharopine dehydrogenase-like NADP-dependent oxidoreductase